MTGQLKCTSGRALPTAQSEWQTNSTEVHEHLTNMHVAAGQLLNLLGFHTHQHPRESCDWLYVGLPALVRISSAQLCAKALPRTARVQLLSAECL